MKKMMIPLAATAVCLALTAQAQKTDILKPVFQEQEQELRRIMERAVSGGWKYDTVTATVVTTSRMHVVTFPKKQWVRLPEDVREKVVKYNHRFSVWHFDKYLDDPKYSLYAAALIFGREPAKIESLPKSIHARDPKAWWEKDASAMKYGLLHICNGKCRYGHRESVPLECYYGSVLFESTPPCYTEHIFAERICKPRANSRVLLVYETSPILPYGCWAFLPMLTAEEYGKFFDSFLKDGDKSALKEIALTQPCVEHWLYLTLFGEEGKRLLALEGLLAWSRIKSPVENPFLSALAMGLFTVNGYAFNDGTGVYTLNKRGKMLMDFIVEFPIPENATRLQAVMNGGNKDEIEDMMKKHGTEEKWAELLKNPIHPEFAKYPQD